MQLVREKLYKEFSTILTEIDLNFIENKTREIMEKEAIDNPQKYLKIFNKNVAKFVYGKFNNLNSQNFLKEFTNKIFAKPKNNLNYITELSELFIKIKAFPSVDIILNLIKDNEQLYNCLNNIYESNKNIILSAKIDNIIDDEIFHQFMEVF